MVLAGGSVIPPRVVALAAEIPGRRSSNVDPVAASPSR